MRSSLLVPALCFLVLAGFAPAVSAHGPPPPPGSETRLLEDWTDDCGGDGGAATGNCRGSEDLLGLGIQESYDADHGYDVAIFRLYADKGQAGSHRDVVTVKTPSGTKTFTFATSDGATFTNGGGFDSVGSAHKLAGEETRFTVEGRVRLAALGAVGEKVTDFKVESFVGSSVGDFMPGGCHNTVGDCADPTGSAKKGCLVHGGSASCSADGQYTLRGPTYYVTLTAPESATVAQGSEQMVELTVRNSLDDQPQHVTLKVGAHDGVTARFHNPSDPSGTGYSDEGAVDLPARGSSVIHLALTGTAAGTQASLQVTVDTDQGGRVVKSIAYTVTEDEGGGHACDSSMAGMEGMEGMAPCTTSPPATKGSPLPTLPLLLIALALVGLARRS